MKSKFLGLLLLFVAVIGIFGCTVKNEDVNKTVIKVACWGTPEDLSIIKNTLKGWEKLNPHVEIRIESVVYSSYVNKVLTRIAGGAAPDVIFTEVDMFADFFDKDPFLDLTPFIEKDENFNINEYFSEVVDRFTIDGKIYCIPRDTAPFACVFYNKDLFDKFGVEYPTDDWDWDEMVEKAKKMTVVENNRVVSYGFFAWAWQNFVYSNGGSMVDDVKNPTQCTLNSDAAVEGLQFHTDLIQKYKVSPSQSALSNMGTGVSQLFMQQRLAMFASGIWETPQLRKIDSFDWDVAMFPKGPKGKRGYGTGGSGYCILKTTQYPQEAWEVVKALSGDYGQIKFAEAGMAQPANKRIAEGEYWAKSTLKPLNKKMLNEAVQYVTYNPFHPKWRKIMALVVTPELDLMFNGNKTAREAMDIAVPKANEMLKNNL